MRKVFNDDARPVTGLYSSLSSEGYQREQWLRHRRNNVFIHERLITVLILQILL